MIKLKILEQLAKRNLTQTQLAQITEINKNAISSYCNNTCKHIVVEHLDRICKALLCDVNDIVEFKNEDLNQAQNSIKDMLMHISSHMVEDINKNNNDYVLKQILSEVFTSKEFLSLLATKTMCNIPTILKNETDENNNKK